MASWLKQLRPDVLIQRSLSNPRFDIETVLLDILDHPNHGIDQRRDLMAKKAVDIVTAHIQRNEFGPLDFPHSIMIDAAWVEKK